MSKPNDAAEQAKALAALIDEADDDIARNGTVSREELADELLALEAEWDVERRPSKPMGRGR